MPSSERNPTAAYGVHATKSTGSVPSCRKCHYAAATATCHAAVIAIRRQIQIEFLRDKRQKFMDQETDVVVVDSILFEVAIAPPERAPHRRMNIAGPERLEIVGHLLNLFCRDADGAIERDARAG